MNYTSRNNDHNLFLNFFERAFELLLNFRCVTHLYVLFFIQLQRSEILCAFLSRNVP